MKPKISHDVECRWTAYLNVVCPDCSNIFDYFGSDHYCDGGFEGLGHVAQECEVEGVPCPECGANLNLKVQGGL